MRIGIFDPYLDTLSGGEKYMLSIASCLSLDNDVFVFWDKEKEIRLAALKKLGIDLSSIKFHKNIFNRSTSTFKRFVESRKFDSILYLSDGSIPFVGTKLFVHFQSPIEWVHNVSFKTRLKLHFVEKVFCNSYFTKNFIDKKLNIKSLVLYPPVVINNSRKIKKENIILHVGRFNVDKNGSNYKKQDVMINSFKKIIDQGLKDWEFVMAIGVLDKDREDFNKLKEISKDYPITVIDNPSNDNLWEQYLRAKIYWHATGFGEDLDKYPEKAEHFGISTVEAMGAGAVPVVFNAGGQKEIVENGKSGYLWDSLEDFAAKTKFLIEDKKLWGEMSRDAIKRSKVFIGNRFRNDLKKIIR